MIKVAVLDDYQDVFQQIVEIEKYKKKFDFHIFKEPFSSENEAIVALEEFEVLFIMRERTPITKELIKSHIRTLQTKHTNDKTHHHRIH